jgi:PBP1b-binding outer membrane lipoprotein LpoB
MRKQRAMATIAAIALALLLTLTGCVDKDGQQPKKPSQTTQAKPDKSVVVTGTIVCNKKTKTHPSSVKVQGTGGAVFGQKTGTTTYNSKTGKFSVKLKKLRAPLFGYQVGVVGCGMKKRRWAQPMYKKVVNIRCDEVVWFDR